MVAVDIGGTHARFALATIDDRQKTSIGPEVTFKTAEFGSFVSAWQAFARRVGRTLPDAAAIAIASPVEGTFLKLTNCPWVIRRDSIAADLGIAEVSLVNDFGAVAHAIAALDDKHFGHLCGPQGPLRRRGAISVVGPGTGLGVAQLLLSTDGNYEVVESEGGHIDFAAIDTIDDAILLALRQRFGRVSVERLASGPGLINIYETLARLEGRETPTLTMPELWAKAIGGNDLHATLALDRFCLCLGGIAGDIALVHGAGAVIIGGGLGLRLAELLPLSGFEARFTAKGRFAPRMASIPVKIITYRQPGLLGAAVAFARGDRV